MQNLTEMNQSIARQEFYLGLARKGHKRYVPIEKDLERDLKVLERARDAMLINKDKIIDDE